MWKVNMFIGLLLLFCLWTVDADIIFKDLNLNYRGVQLTPRGTDHPVVNVKDLEIIFEHESIPPFLYAGKAVFMGYRAYWDLDVCRYERELNASCIVITSTNPYTPGSNINKGFNNCTYSCAFEMLYPDFVAFSDIYKVLMEESLGTAVVRVDLDGASEPNPWKLMAYSASFMINVGISGVVCLLVIIGSSINLTLITIKKKTHMVTWIIIHCSLIMSGVVGLIGFLDFNCFLQVLPYRTCNVFSSMRPAFVFAAINLLSYSMLEAIKMQIGDMKIVPSNFWVSVAVSFIYLGMTITCSATITYLNEYSSIIALLVVWLALELGYQTYTAILNTIISIRTLVQLKRLAASVGKLSDRKNQIRRMMFQLITIASCTVVYVIFVGLVNESVYYPWFLVGTWFVYNQLLNVISLILIVSMFFSITRNMDKKKTSSSSVNSGKSTDTNGSYSKNRTSTIDMTVQDSHTVHES